MKPFNMKLLAGVSALAVAVAGGYAVAQTIVGPQVQTINSNDLFQDVVTGVPTAGNVYASALQLRNYILGLNSQRGVSNPTVLTCGGTNPGSVSTNSTDLAGILTVGTLTTCAISFHTAFVSTPVCAITSQTAYGTSTASYTVTNTGFVVTHDNTGGEIYDYICVAQTGG